jgi:hypothetical protein
VWRRINFTSCLSVEPGQELAYLVGFILGRLIPERNFQSNTSAFHISLLKESSSKMVPERGIIRMLFYQRAEELNRAIR